MKFENIRYPKDVYPNLPGMLVMPKEELDCFIHLGEKGINQIIEEAKKKDPYKPLFLSFATKVHGSPECPHVFNYSSLDWDNVVDVRISGNTCDYWDNHTRQAFQYILIVLETETEF